MGAAPRSRVYEGRASLLMRAQEDVSFESFSLEEERPDRLRVRTQFFGVSINKCTQTNVSLFSSYRNTLRAQTGTGNPFLSLEMYCYHHPFAN